MVLKVIDEKGNQEIHRVVWGESPFEITVKKKELVGCAIALLELAIAQELPPDTES